MGLKVAFSINTIGAKMLSGSEVASEDSCLNAKRPKHDSPMEGTASTMKLFVKKQSATAQLPARATPEAAGYDLFANADLTITAKGKALVDTGIAIAIPAGYYGRIAPRSGLAHKFFIDVGAGVIDADYRGNVGVILFNFGEKDFAVKVGDRIAQLLIEKIANPDVVEVESLDDTVRKDGGFGSTGVSSQIPQ